MNKAEKYKDCKIKGKFIMREGVQTVNLPLSEGGVREACQFKNKLCVLMNSGTIYLIDTPKEKKWWEFWK